MKQKRNVNRENIIVKRLSLGVVMVVAALSIGSVANAADTKPNIVLVFADNLGYGELGSYGGGILRGAPTPRIDGLASEGTRFLNFNVE